MTSGSGKTSYNLFEDDRSSALSLSSGEFGWLNLTAGNTPASITLDATQSGSLYPGLPAKRTLTFVIHNVDKPAAVTSPSRVKHSYDSKTRTLTVTASSATLPLSIVIRK